jgi:hypothetical protein
VYDSEPPRYEWVVSGEFFYDNPVAVAAGMKQLLA